MKVIKDNYHGSKEITCHRCKSILEVTSNDIKYNSEIYADYIRCPLCKAMINVDKSTFGES